MRVVSSSHWRLEYRSNYLCKVDKADRYFFSTMMPITCLHSREQNSQIAKEQTRILIEWIVNLIIWKRYVNFRCLHVIPRRLGNKSLVNQHFRHRSLLVIWYVCWSSSGDPVHGVRPVEGDRDLSHQESTLLRWIDSYLRHSWTHWPPDYPFPS